MEEYDNKNEIEYEEDINDFYNDDNQDIFSQMFEEAKNINDFKEIISLESSNKIGEWSLKCYEKIIHILTNEKDYNQLYELIQ